MGLDMYLKAKIYMSKYSKEELVKKAEKVRELFGEMFKIGNLDSVDISFEVGYWRKANAIHKWFVDNCQNGEDDCKDYYVSRKQLIELKEICKKIQSNNDKAKELLPTQTGFFFGGKNYDEWYFNDLEQTIKIIDRCLELSEDWKFEYGSSW